MRSLEDHLSPHELVSLPGSPEALASGTPDQRQMSQHLQQCEVCSSLAKTYWNLRRLGAPSTSARTGELCPPQTVWLEFAAGLHPERASTLSAHASNCTTCTDALHDAMELMQPNQVDAVKEPIEGLASSDPAWQRQMAAQMRAATKSPSSEQAPKVGFAQRLRRTPVWIALPVAAALLLGVALGSISLWRAEHPSETRLLALAYNKQRTMVLRIPGADPVPLASGTRGSTPGLSDSTDLLKLSLRAQQHLDETPNSAYWHQILGRIQLLQQDGLAARRNFEIAQTADENLPDLKSDLAAAWFEIGDKSGNTESYAEAAELYSKQLQDHPGDPALLYYNRALCWERQGLIGNALDDLHTALSLERSAGWRKAIQVEIDRLSQHSAVVPTDGYEPALDEATAKLLPLWSDSTEAREKIAHTAALGLQHQDRWLLDWVGTKHTPVSMEADRHLAAAVSTGNAGEAESSLAEARRAVALYLRAQHHPGLMRAELAETYALQRLGRAKECLTVIANLPEAAHSAYYGWLQARSVKAQADCEGMKDDFSSQQRSLERAVILSSNFDLPLMKMRAVGAQVEMTQSKGLNVASWQMSVNALQRCHLAPCPAIIEYSYLYPLVIDAQTLNLPRVAVEIMRSATQLAKQTDNATTYAYALEELGTLSGRIGEYTASANAFQLASEVARSGRQGPMAAIYQADWQTDRAEILSRRGMHAAAMNLLQQNGPILLSSGYQLGRLRYLQQLAIVEASLERYDDALASAWKSVHEAERTLATLRSPLEKEHWQSANQSSYAELIKIYLQHGENTPALEVWERFRSAPYRSLSAEDLGDELSTTDVSSTRILILARINDAYVGWVASTRPLHVLAFKNLGSSDSLLQTARIFYRLCADPKSSLADIKLVGLNLYISLIQPFKDQVASANHIWIETDPSLAMLPVSALQLPDGKWLGAVSQITVVSPWWSIHPDVSLANITVTPLMHMVAVSGFNDSHTADSEAPELARLFARATVLKGTSANSQSVLSNLPSADIFHFVGHASPGSGMLLSSTEVLTPDVLGSVHLRRCKVGVLAACNTTAADPDQVEKMSGLRDALLLSGVRSAVASTWDVDDQSTQTLMHAFYSQLVLGRSTTQSLQYAQQSVRSNLDWQHPYYWAAFEVFNN